MDLLSEPELPENFSYPQQFMRAIACGLADIEPWYLLVGQPLRDTMKGLKARYPDRKLIPFARRQDNDDIACWQAGADESVFIVHDFAAPGWESRDKFINFYDWLRRAIEDFIEFE